jgi:hypothetical protein
MQSAQSGVRLRARPQVDGRVVLAEALEQRGPVADAGVELRRRRASIDGEIDQVGRTQPARGVLEPGIPERPGVAEGPVEIDGYGGRDRHAPMIGSPHIPASG